MIESAKSIILLTEACRDCDVLTVQRMLKINDKLHYVECVQYLSIAATNGCLDIIKLLAEASCGREIEDKRRLQVTWKEAALDALEAGHTDVYEYIMKKIIKEQTDD